MSKPRRLPVLAHVALAAALAACNPQPPEGTGGTDVEPGPFGRGIVTINTDFQSTNVSLVGLEGRRLSEHFISSTSLLSADVHPPTMASLGDDIVLLDRQSGVVTWVDVRTSKIRVQFHSDGDEMAKNPWDYLPVGPNKAYILRYDPWHFHDKHGDVIVIDPEVVEELTPIDRRIDVAGALGLSSKWDVHPARGLVVGDRAYFTTVIASEYYGEYGTSQLVVLDTTTDEVVDVRALEGLHDCTGMAVSPSGAELAVICSGDLYANSEVGPERSAVVLLSRDGLTENQRIPASALGPGPLGFWVSYASERSLVVTAFGGAAHDTDDRAVWVDLDTQEAREAYRSGPVAISAVLCPARVDGSADTTPPACFVTDAEKGRLLRFPVEDGALGAPRSLVVDEVVGLPPRYLGQF
jgi:hypothetical protein